mmetsp:Transcript_40736/g.62175  ORF Transcript_40736/g.62175 Transcript_40736/m.62175 type:complete len:151 (-) Transcript_40736:1223-1675(-)
MVVCSGATAIQKKYLVSALNDFQVNKSTVASIVAHVEDAFFSHDASVVISVLHDHSPMDLTAIGDIHLRDFSGLTYLLFKHGNVIPKRLIKVLWLTIYKLILVGLILLLNFSSSGFSGNVNLPPGYMWIFLLILSPFEILLIGIFYTEPA